MTNQFYLRILVIAGASALTACASTPSGNSAEPPSAATAQANLAMASHAAATSEAANAPLGTPGGSLKPGNGYRKVTKNGQVYYCQKEATTGSRVNAKVVCLTQDEMTALSQNGQDLLNGIRSVPGSQGSTDGFGGTTNSAVSY
ncbi:MAG: hypothetical protein ABI616_14750 [Pseudomonadota bacterium]